MKMRGAIAALAVCGMSAAALAQQTPAAMPIIERPMIPARTFSIADFGAMAGGKTMNTEALRKAILACSKAGGGTVLIPPGTYLTGPFTLTSNLNLHLENGALLQLSDNPDDFPVTSDKHQDAITARECHDLEITGDGIIDGNGAPGGKPTHAPRPPQRCPLG